MKKYKYITCKSLEQYEGWEIVQVIEASESGISDMAIIMKEDIPVQDYIKLNEATTDQLLNELSKRLNKEE